jgi:hypothetical protein
MLRALLYLRLTSLKNLLLAQLRRLRQPRYLFGALFAIAYFYFFFFRHTAGPPPSASHTPTLDLWPANTPDLISAIVSVGLFIVFALMWAAPSDRAGLHFSEAEIAFLFPAPLTRRRLVHYKVLSAQFTALLQSLLYALLFHTRRLFSSDALLILLAWWAVLSVLTLHYQASSLTVARLTSADATPWRGRLLRGFALAVVAFVLATLLREIARLPPHLDLVNDFAQWLPAVVSSGPLRWLFQPFAWFAQPFFARDAFSLLTALGPVLLILAAHYLWVVRLNVAFEERALSHAERSATRIAELRRTGMLRVGAPRTAGRPAPFDLSRVRAPEFAFLWKNLLSTTRPWFTPRIWLGCALALVVLFAGGRILMGDTYWKLGGILAALGSITGGLTLLYGPLLTRLDLRQDLANSDLLKTYPLPGWRILLGELLTPIAVLTGIVWLAVLAWILGLTGHEPPNLSPTWLNHDMRIVFSLCAAFITPIVIALELLIPNAVPLVFPSWFNAVRTPGPGLDLMGQRLIFGFGQVFVVCVALLPAAATAALLIFILHGWLNLAPALCVALATLTVAVVLVGELWCGLWLLGQRFEKFDLSAEPRA